MKHDPRKPKSEFKFENRTRVFTLFLLDTDTSIFLLNRKTPAVELKLRELPREELGVSTITMVELLYGAAHSKKPQANEKRVQI